MDVVEDVEERRDTREDAASRDAVGPDEARRGTAGLVKEHTAGQARRAGTSERGGMSQRLVLIFAVATGIVVANLYYAQPLLDTIAREFHTTSGAVGLIVTLTQIGYALGLLFIVPLGDLLERRRLVVTVLVGTTLALAGSALAPTIGVLAGLVGVTSVVAQVLIPFAASLAPEAERGRVVGTVMSGLLVGVLLARTFAGLIAQAAGWRAVYWIAAALMLAMIAALWHELPQVGRPAAGMKYGRLLESVWGLVRTEPVLRRRSVYGALAFASFSVLWTSIAFLLARPPYGYGQAVIGLFGLLGVAGALCASVAGRLADRGWARYSTGAFVVLSLAAFGLLALGGARLLPLVAGIVLLDLGVQGTQITNQSEIYRLRPEARSRITTAYMVSYFIGGAVGSFASAVAYGAAGWAGVCLLGAAFAAANVTLWVVELWGRLLGVRGRSHSGQHPGLKSRG